MNSHPEQTYVVDRFALSPLQHGMLFHHLQFGRGTGVDIEQLAATLHEDIKPEIFKQAWQIAADRHPTLRTQFAWDGLDRPEQQVLRAVDVPVSVSDLRAASAEEQKAKAAAFLAEDRQRGFDLGEAPLWRVTLWRLADQTHWMVWTYSHAILDGCYADVLREVFDTYEGLERGAPPSYADRPSYRDHITWLDADLRSRASDAADFWRRRLAGFVTPTGLDAIQRRASDLTSGHDTVRFRLSRATSDGIRRAAAAHEARTYNFVEAAWALVLSAFSGEDDVVFGSTRACRRSSVPGAESMIGLFINTVPVRVSTTPDTPLPTLVAELRRHQLAVQPFEHTPLVDITACTDLKRGTSLFDTIVVFNDRDNDARFKSWGGRWASRNFELHDQTNFPMNVMVYDEPELAFKLSYARGRFERASVERVADLLVRILETMAEHPEARLADLPRVPGLDEAMLAAFNATDAPVPSPGSIHEAFEVQVDRSPDEVALVFRGQSLSFRELDARANRVAHELRALGVGPDAMVGVFVERSLELVVGLLGILKAGGAYVPMDPSYPRDRIATMLEDTQSRVVLTLERLRGALPATTAQLVTLDAFGAERSAVRPAAGVLPHHLAYVIFTSGSTGRPKGVQIEHAQVANFFGAMDRTLGTTPGVWLALTSISFDISVLELFWTLTRGFTVVLQEEAERVTLRSTRRAPQARPMGFSLFYFAADAGEATGQKYRLLIEGAKFADAHDFEAVWTPERHFHPFGGLYPNPAVTGAAVAMVTSRVAIRAGSVVLPLHHPIRCAEEWSVVDNLSNGRVGLSFASGWHASDFALAPGNFADRRELMARGIETVRALWRGESVSATSGDGSTIRVKMYPPPVQARPGVWITASGNPETFAFAGRIGAWVLTNLLVMNRTELAANIQVYRRAYREAGHPGDGHVSLMLHTFIGDDVDEVRARVRAPFLAYLRTSTDLVNKAKWERTAFAKADDRSVSHAATRNLDELSAADMDAILDHAVERYMTENGLFGTPESSVATVSQLSELGVDEIACLIDFGLDTDTVLAGLTRLDSLRRLCAPVTASAEGTVASDDSFGIAAQIRRHRVTHMQCTPSLLGLLMLDREAVDAVRSLRQLLVGGEALPAALVSRLGPERRGTLRNMYGPTETTIWSTTAAIEGPDAITIGRPIANTIVRIVDRRLRPVPVGVPGELLIGGKGVARGYLARPELTAERFVTDRTNGARFYRTGDQARWLPSGDIEFLGRLDHQVKIRGYRIEPGEIESVLTAHPSVRESVVVSREGPGGDARLVAYVVADSRDLAAQWGASTADWQAIWDETYRAAPQSVTGLDTAGWTSSITGRAIPDAEMREWADQTAARILAAAPPTNRGRLRVLEIGCGTGMLVSRVAPLCERYVGVDISAEALARVRAQVEAQGLQQVTLEKLAAHELADLHTAGPFDLIVLNSVAQYFPDAAYLTRVLTDGYARLSPGGALFIGDVRSLAHVPLQHAAIELARADQGTFASDVHAQVQRRIAEEGELALDPRLFEVLARAWPEAQVERAEVKAGQAWNEMTAFRYDVVLRKGGEPRSIGSVRTVTATDSCTREWLAELLGDQPDSVRVVAVPNRRLVGIVAGWTRLTAAPSDRVADIRTTVGRLAGGVDPDEIRRLSPHHEVAIEFSPDDPALLEVLFWRRGPLGARPPRVRPTPSQPIEALANRPVRRGTPSETATSLVTSLRDHARRKLPEYMVPSAFVVLDALPLTPNGKIDRRALPAPDAVQAAPRTLAPPKNDLERTIVSVFQELVGGHAISIDDNFFDAGANSLLMVQASIRLRAALGREVSLVHMFQHPTARALAATLATPTSPSPEAVGVLESQDRAQVRRAALQRRRGTPR